MRQQGRILAFVICGFLIGCNNSGKDNEVAVSDSTKRPLNSEQLETPLALAIKSSAPTVAVEEWTSDPALQAQLGEETSDASFAFRVPPGFNWKGSSGNAREYVNLWHSVTRDDKSVAKFRVRTGRLNTENKNMSLEQAAAEMLKFDQQRFSNVVPGKASNGTIHGIPFYKTTFTMDEKETSLHGRATVYYGHLGNHYIYLVYHDFEPHLAETEKLLEAAALSVRPKP